METQRTQYNNIQKLLKRSFTPFVNPLSNSIKNRRSFQPKILAFHATRWLIITYEKPTSEDDVLRGCYPV